MSNSKSKTYRSTAIRASWILLTLALLTLLGPASALAGEEEAGSVYVIDSALMDALQAWSENPTSLEQIALESAPEAVALYGETVGDLYSGGLAAHFAERFPAAELLYLELGGTEDDGSEGNAQRAVFLMSHRPEDYRAWQAEKLLKVKGLRFTDFVEDEHPELLDVWAEAEASTPAAQGESLLDFVAGQEDPELYASASSLLDAVAIPIDTECGCFTTVAFPGNPSSRQVIYDEHWVRNGFHREEVDYRVDAEGSAANVDYYRLARRHPTAEHRVTRALRQDMRVRMQCVRGGVAGGRPCQGGGCQAELVTRIEYGSRVYERTASGGWFNHGAKTLTSNVANLQHSVGSAGPSELFNKSVGVSGNTRLAWNSQAVSTLLQSVFGVINLIVGDQGSALAGILEGNLIDDTVTSIAALIEREGSPGSHAVDMLVSHDTTRGISHELRANQTHVFEMTAYAEVYGEGHGDKSESWGEVDSAYGFAAVVRDYQCPFPTQAPNPGAYWSWASTPKAPISATTLADNIADWIQVELGVRPTNTSVQEGELILP